MDATVENLTANNSKVKKENQLRGGNNWTEREVSVCAGGRWLDGDVWWLTWVKNVKCRDAKQALTWNPHQVLDAMTSPSCPLFIGSRDINRFQALTVFCIFFHFKMFSSSFSSGLPLCIMGTVVSHQVSTAVALSSGNRQSPR